MVIIRSTFKQFDLINIRVEFFMYCSLLGLILKLQFVQIYKSHMRIDYKKKKLSIVIIEIPTNYRRIFFIKYLLHFVSNCEKTK